MSHKTKRTSSKHIYFLLGLGCVLLCSSFLYFFCLLAFLQMILSSCSCVSNIYLAMTSLSSSMWHLSGAASELLAVAREI